MSKRPQLDTPFKPPNKKVCQDITKGVATPKVTERVITLLEELRDSIDHLADILSEEQSQSDTEKDE